MAIKITDKVYVNGGYLDSNVSVSSIKELIDKFDFLGQSIHMAEAFVGASEISYPLDFWMVPNGDDIKWEIKNLPSLENEDDFGNFKAFCNQFKSEANYYPLAEGSKILVNGSEYEFIIDDDNNMQWVNSQELFDEALESAVTDAVNKVTSGASDAFDTLKEIEEWINNNGTGVDYSKDIEDLKSKSHEHDNKEILDGITEEKISAWDSAEQNAKDYADGLANNYDAAGAAENALTEAKSYADGLASNYDAAGSAASAEQNAKDYADGLASNYDAAGAAENALTEANTYTDNAVTDLQSKIEWIEAEETGTKHIVRHWRGTRENYELLKQAGALNAWTKYVVIDNITDTQKIITEYFGENQIAEHTGQLLPVNSIIETIESVTNPNPYDRYLVGKDGIGYRVYECALNNENNLKWYITQFDDKYGVRVRDRGLKNFVYVDGKLITYDDVNCGEF